MKRYTHSGYQQDAKHLYELLSDPRIASSGFLFEIQRSILRLRMVDNKSFREISQQLDVREDWARVNYQFVIKELKEKLIKALEVFRASSYLFEENEKIKEENARLKIQLDLREPDPNEERPVDPEILKMPIDNLGLCIRAFRLLKENQVRTVEELLAYSYTDLLKIKQMGQRSVEDIKYSLEKLGINLKSPYELV